MTAAAPHAEKTGSSFRVLKNRAGRTLDRRRPDESVLDFIARNKNRLAGADLRGWPLAGLDITDLDLRGTAMDGANLAGANLPGVKMNDKTTASGLVCPGASMRYGTLNGAHLDGIAGEDLDLTGVQADRTRFVGGDLHNAYLDGMEGFQTNFAGTILSGTTMLGSALNEPDFCGATFFDSSCSREWRIHVGDRTKGSTFEKGFYSETDIPDSWSSLQRDAEITQDMSSAPVKTAVRFIPGADAGMELADALFSFAERTGAAHLIDRVLPTSVKRWLKDTMIKAGAYPIWRLKSDSWRDLKDGALRSVDFNAGTWIDRVRAAAGDTEDANYISRRYAAREGNIGPAIVCEGGIEADALTVASLYKRKLPSRGAITLVDPTPTPRPDTPAALRFDTAGMTVSYFDGEAFSRTVHYDKSGKVTKQIDADGRVSTHARNLSQEPSLDSAVNSFIKSVHSRTGWMTRTSSSVALAIGIPDLAAPWDSHQLRHIRGKDWKCVTENMRPFLDMAAESLRQSGDLQGFMKARAAGQAWREAVWSPKTSGTHKGLLSESREILRKAANVNPLFERELRDAALATCLVERSHKVTPTLTAGPKAAQNTGEAR